MNYAEYVKQINNIRRKDEMMFRMAISHLMDVGIRHLTDENIEYTCQEIMKEDDSHSFMSNDYKCGIVRTAGQLTKIPHTTLLAYISENVYYDVGQKQDEEDEDELLEKDIDDDVYDGLLDLTEDEGLSR